MGVAVLHVVLLRAALGEAEHAAAFAALFHVAQQLYDPEGHQHEQGDGDDVDDEHVEEGNGLRGLHRAEFHARVDQLAHQRAVGDDAGGVVQRRGEVVGALGLNGQLVARDLHRLHLIFAQHGQELGIGNLLGHGGALLAEEAQQQHQHREQQRIDPRRAQESAEFIVRVLRGRSARIRFVVQGGVSFRFLSLIIVREHQRTINGL